MSYQRPTEEGQSRKKISFWANLWDPDDSPVGHARISPNFGTQAELVGWVRVNRLENTQVAAWKRTSWGTDFTDERLSTREEPDADPGRLKSILEDLARMLDAKKRELDRKRAA